MKSTDNMKETKLHLLGTKRVVGENVNRDLAEIILNYAVKNEMTIKNLRESMYLVEECMEENAVIRKEDLDMSKSSQDYTEISRNDTDNPHRL